MYRDGMIRLAAVPLTLLMLALSVAACGGDDGPSQEEWARNANEICTDAEKHLQDLGQANSVEQVANQIDTVVDEMQTSVDRLQDLDRPDGEAGEKAQKAVDSIASDIEDKGIPALEDLRDAIRDKDQQAAQQAYQRLQAVETSDSDKLAREAGLKGCAN
jgi:cytochrome c556